MAFGETLKFHRENSGFSQQDVANQLNISRQSISKWE
ncbi:helix-turn-helix transcriptional regulator, partial [Enterococcus sp. PFB1-1]